MKINLVTQSDIARATGKHRSQINVEVMRGVYPPPDFTINGSTPLWLPETVAHIINSRKS